MAVKKTAKKKAHPLKGVAKSAAHKAAISAGLKKHHAAKKKGGKAAAVKTGKAAAAKTGKKSYYQKQNDKIVKLHNEKRTLVKGSVDRKKVNFILKLKKELENNLRDLKDRAKVAKGAPKKAAIMKQVAAMTLRLAKAKAQLQEARKKKPDRYVKD